MKKIDKNKLIDNSIKQSQKKIHYQKINERSTSNNIKEFKFNINNNNENRLISSKYQNENKFNKFKMLNTREDIENVLSKIISKIGNQQKNEMSPVRELEIDSSLNKINNLREKIQNNAENKLQKYTTKSNIKLELPEENLKDNENLENFFKIETLNFNIIKSNSNKKVNDYDFNENCNNPHTIENNFIKTKTIVSSINQNSNINLYTKLNLLNSKNLSINDSNKRNYDFRYRKATKYITNRVFEMSPHQLNRIKIKNVLSMSPLKTPSIDNHRTHKSFQYVIKKGNNYELIKRCFMLRSNWKELTATATTIYNYKWQETKKKIEYVLLNKNILNSNQTKMVNHFEFDPEISNKKFMFINFLLYCDKINLNVFDFVPMTVIVKYNSPNFPKNLKNFSLMFKNIHKFIKNENQVKSLYSDNFVIDGFESLKKTNIEINKTHFREKNFWILKPTDLYGGRCIYISNNLEEIEKLIKNFFDGMDKSLKKKPDLNDLSDSDESSEEIEETKSKKYRTSTIILQKYIEDPLLYKGRKFDIRMWVLIDQNMEIYLFKEGHLKTASVNYDLSTTDKFVHITNYSLQKYNNNFNKHEHGNEVSFKEFQEFLNNEYKQIEVDIKKDLYPKIIDIIRLTIKSVKDKINRKNRKFCYVILGYDFMIDINFKIWLIEINKNPGLSFSSPIIEMLLPRMIDDSFRLTIDKVFDPIFYNNDQYKYKSPYIVEGYDDFENLW